jgi:predicted house-cleaning noncanonical NTP pyrophosphatase (MazG superfamily)
MLEHKAIRDKIPKIIKESGSDYNVKQLSDQEFLEKLEEKLSEEIIEYQNDKNPEELADILEVIYRIAQLKGISKEELEQIRINKVKERGEFKKNLCIIGTSKND